MKRFLTKRGYAVRMPDGEYRGVYRSFKTADLIATLTYLEMDPFDPRNAVVVPCRMWFWRNGGLHMNPVTL